MKPCPVNAESIPEPERKTIYPPPFASRVEGRIKRKLGDFFGLSNFGVNFTRLEPGAVSALLHHHSKQDEFIYIIQGTPTLVFDDQHYVLKPGDCFGFKAGTGLAHQLINHSAEDACYIEIGDRTPNDKVEYPNDDLKASQHADGQWHLTHKDGRAY